MKLSAKKAFFFLLALGGTAIAGYAFHFFASRYLGPARYGEYTALMALMLALARPLEALSPLVARVIAENNDQDWRTFLYSFFCLALLSGAILGGALLLCCFLWGNSLGLPLSAVTYFASLTLMAWAFLYIFRGVLQGRFIDESYLLNRPAELLGRLLGGLPLFALGGGLIAAILASLAGALVGIAHITAVIRSSLINWRDHWHGPLEPAIFTQFLKIMLLWLAGGFFIGLDMILVKHLLSPVESGLYAIANLIGKGVLVYAVTILPVIYPRLVKYRLRRESWSYLGLCLAYFAGIFLASALLFAWWGQAIIPFFFGAAYRPAAELIPMYLVAAFPISLNFAVINLASAIGDWSECFFFWLALAVYFLALWFSPPEFSAYLWRIGIFQTLAAAGGLFFLIWRERKD